MYEIATTTATIAITTTIITTTTTTTISGYGNILELYKFLEQ